MNKLKNNPDDIVRIYNECKKSNPKASYEYISKKLHHPITKQALCGWVKRKTRSSQVEQIEMIPEPKDMEEKVVTKVEDFLRRRSGFL